VFRFLLLLILSISSVIGQVNIEGLRNPELDKTNFSVEVDSDIATQSNKDNWEITSELRFDKLFDNQSSILVVVEGEYSEQTVDSIKDVQENKGFIHTRYVVPLQSYELETFGQIELDNFRSILNRNLLGMGLRFTAQSTKVDNLNYGIGMMYEHEKYDGSFIDCGCNFGAYSIPIAKEFEDQNIYAFDASKKAIHNLEKNIDLNKLKNINYFNIGIGEKNTEMYFNEEINDLKNDGSFRFTENKSKKKINISIKFLFRPS